LVQIDRIVKESKFLEESLVGELDE
jgi:hypothetical protein